MVHQKQIFFKLMPLSSKKLSLISFISFFLQTNLFSIDTIGIIFVNDLQAGNYEFLDYVFIPTNKRSRTSDRPRKLIYAYDLKKYAEGQTIDEKFDHVIQNINKTFCFDVSQSIAIDRHSEFFPKNVGIIMLLIPSGVSMPCFVFHKGQKFVRRQLCAESISEYGRYIAANFRYPFNLFLHYEFDFANDRFNFDKHLPKRVSFSCILNILLQELYQ